jgi:hypothetical protein
MGACQAVTEGTLRRSSAQSERTNFKIQMPAFDLDSAFANLVLQLRDSLLTLLISSD